MFFDLNVPVPQSTQSQPKKAKGKNPQPANPLVYTAAQISAVDARVQLLVHLGYSVIAFNQTAYKRVEAKTHINVLDDLINQLKKRPSVVFLKRLTIVLDEESEKGFGLTNANASLFSPYDLIALVPTTAATFTLACITHSVPSPLTAHIIALPLSQPRPPFHLKHTLVRTAIKNGAVFEINYAGALGAESDPWDTRDITAPSTTTSESAKRNWWAAARELTRVTKGKGIIVSGGVVSEADLRAPKDVSNLITLLGLPPDAAHDSVAKTPKSLVLRAQTRKTYRAVFSEPKLVIPPAQIPADAEMDVVNEPAKVTSQHENANATSMQQNELAQVTTLSASTASGQSKRARGPDDANQRHNLLEGEGTDVKMDRRKKRKGNKNITPG